MDGEYEHPKGAFVILSAAKNPKKVISGGCRTSHPIVLTFNVVVEAAS
jgi:hypothetical protein